MPSPTPVKACCERTVFPNARIKKIIQLSSSEMGYVLKFEECGRRSEGECPFNELERSNGLAGPGTW